MANSIKILDKLYTAIAETSWLYLFEILTFFVQFENDIRNILINITRDAI